MLRIKMRAVEERAGACTKPSPFISLPRPYPFPTARLHPNKLPPQHNTLAISMTMTQDYFIQSSIKPLDGAEFVFKDKSAALTLKIIMLRRLHIIITGK